MQNNTKILNEEVNRKLFLGYGFVKIIGKYAR